MIMKDTMEHDLYTRNNDEDVRQVEFEFQQQDDSQKLDDLGLDGVQVCFGIRKYLYRCMCMGELLACALDR